MLDVLSVLFISLVSITIVAALVYIGGFLVSMFITMFTAPIDAIERHRHHPAVG